LRKAYDTGVYRKDTGRTEKGEPIERFAARCFPSPRCGAVPAPSSDRHLPIEVTGIISRLHRRLHAVNTGAGRGVDGRILLPLLHIFTAPAVAATSARTEWADSQGGHDGAVARVTNLNPDGPGWFKAAVERRRARPRLRGRRSHRPRPLHSLEAPVGFDGSLPPGQLPGRSMGSASSRIADPTRT
jgi:hypothetical protein